MKLAQKTLEYFSEDTEGSRHIKNHIENLGV